MTQVSRLDQVWCHSSGLCKVGSHGFKSWTSYFGHRWRVTNFVGDALPLLASGGSAVGLGVGSGGFWDLATLDFPKDHRLKLRPKEETR